MPDPRLTCCVWKRWRSTGVCAEGTSGERADTDHHDDGGACAPHRTHTNATREEEATMLPPSPGTLVNPGRAAAAFRSGKREKGTGADEGWDDWGRRPYKQGLPLHLHLHRPPSAIRRAPPPPLHKPHSHLQTPLCVLHPLPPFFPSPYYAKTTTPYTSAHSRSHPSAAANIRALTRCVFFTACSSNRTRNDAAPAD